jgi:lipopolysaccharide export system permease protein
MRLHDRYLFRELLTPLAYCLGGFLVFWVSYFFFSQLDEMQEHKLHLFDCAEYALAMMPGFFVMVLPIALLLALLYALTHHARHHELTALRAAGVSLWRLCAPYFVVGLMAGGIYFFLNEVAVPRSADWSQEILNRYTSPADDQPVPLSDPSSKPVRRPNAANVKAGASKTRFFNVGFRSGDNHIWQIGEYNAATRTMISPNVAWTLPDGSWRSLRADRAVRTNGVWTFYNAQMFAQTGARGNLMPVFTTNVIGMQEFDETPREILSDLKLSDSQTIRGSRSADIPLKDLREYLRLHPDLSADDAHALRTKYYGRLAAPWTCLVVVFIAIPFGAPSGRRNLFFGVAGSIFICFAYFVLQQVSLAFGMNGHLPPWLAALLPNLFFATTGIVMILRTR